MKNKSARRIALETLISVFKNKSYSNIALNHALKKSDLSSHDKSLVTQLVYGTIQHQIYLDYQIRAIFKENKKSALDETTSNDVYLSTILFGSCSKSCGIR